jgi:dTDP-4-dehydrorhamnose 3,5-epimerase
MVYRSREAKMITEKTHLEDCKLITETAFLDDRGCFFESYRNTSYEQHFVQDNVCITKARTLRGLHIQRLLPQGKLLRVLRGHIMDVIVDLRPSSSTFKQWGAFELSGKKPETALWIPPGFAHGYYAYAESILIYKCTKYYQGELSSGVVWNDPTLNISWPDKKPIISPKDMVLPTMQEFLNQQRR